MAGLPNFATYFGRDMLMTALLMQPVWAPAMSEHVVGSALGKLSPAGDVSHEEALGGQAIRENAAEYNRLVSAGQLARARALLGHLASTRENYIMVDDDFQLPVVAARYLSDSRVPADRKRTFLRVEQHLARLVSNLAFVARKAAPYARSPVATNLVSFPRAPDGLGRWISASWRDSRAGYGGGRFAMRCSSSASRPRFASSRSPPSRAIAPRSSGRWPLGRARSAISGCRSRPMRSPSASRRGLCGCRRRSASTGTACYGARDRHGTRCGFWPCRSMAPGGRSRSSTPIRPWRCYSTRSVAPGYSSSSGRPCCRTRWACSWTTSAPSRRTTLMPDATCGKRSAATRIIRRP